MRSSVARAGAALALAAAGALAVGLASAAAVGVVGGFVEGLGTTSEIYMEDDRRASIGAPMPPARAPTTIAPYRPALEAATSAVLGRAFADDPLLRWMLGGGPRQLARTTWCLRQGVRMTAPHGAAFVLGDPPRAAALWIPPGAPPMPPLARQVAVGNAWAPWICGVGATRRILEREHDARARYARDLREPTWVLDLLGVDPAHQGRGHGRALVEHGLARVDRDGLPAYLVTYNPDNLAFYRSLGFEVIDDTTRAGLPTGWSMRRAARAAA